jgi:hypothetical protein
VEVWKCEKQREREKTQNISKQSGSNFYEHFGGGIEKKTNGRHIKFIFFAALMNSTSPFAAARTRFCVTFFFMMASRETTKKALNFQNLLWRVCSSHFIWFHTISNLKHP